MYIILCICPTAVYHIVTAQMKEDGAGIQNIQLINQVDGDGETEEITPPDYLIVGEIADMPSPSKKSSSASTLSKISLLHETTKRIRKIPVAKHQEDQGQKDAEPV